MPTPQAVRRVDPTGLASAYRVPWWVPLIGGIALIVLSLVILRLPELTAALILRFVGLFWLIDGVVGLASIFGDRTNWGWKLLAGILSVIGGIFVIQHPLWDTTQIPIVSSLVIGVIGVLLGLVQILLATLGSGWRTGVPGVISVSIGLLFALTPMLGAVLLPRALAGAVFVGGTAAIAAGFRRRSAERAYRPEPVSGPPPSG